MIETKEIKPFHEPSYLIGKKEGTREVVETLGLFENEMGFCEISNHIPYKQLKELVRRGE